MSTLNFLSVTAQDTATPADTLTVAGSPQSLTGTGVRANAQLGPESPAPITSVRGCGGSTAPACGTGAVSLTNNGTATLTITGISSATPGTNPGYFGLSNTCGGVVAVGASCTITVTFQPPLSATPNASQTSTLSVQYNSGSGTPALSATTGLSGQESN